MAKEVAEVSTETTTETNLKFWTASGKENSKKKYGVEIMIENGTWEQVNTKECPNDARIIKYEVDGQLRC